jgi:hypothetical protein
MVRNFLVRASNAGNLRALSKGEVDFAARVPTRVRASSSAAAMLDLGMQCCPARRHDVEVASSSDRSNASRRRSSAAGFAILKDPNDTERNHQSAPRVASNG